MDASGTKQILKGYNIQKTKCGLIGELHLSDTGLENQATPQPHNKGSLELKRGVEKRKKQSQNPS